MRTQPEKSCSIECISALAQEPVVGLTESRILLASYQRHCKLYSQPDFPMVPSIGQSSNRGEALRGVELEDFRGNFEESAIGRVLALIL